MKNVSILLMSLLTINAYAVKLNCADINVDIDEVSLKTTFATRADRSIIVSYPTLFRTQLTVGRNPTYRDSYFFPGGKQIFKFNSDTYIYSEKNSSGQVIVPETRCSIE
jgi:hypothetical protein